MSLNDPTAHQKPLFSNDPLAPAGSGTSSVQKWLKRRIGKRVWFSIGATIAFCLFGGMALLIAGQGAIGALLMILGALMVSALFGLVFLGIGVAFLAMIWQVLGLMLRGGRQPVVETPAMPVSDDIADLSRRLEATRQELAKAARLPTFFGLAVGLVAAGVLTWLIVSDDQHAYWFIPVAWLAFPIAGAAIGGSTAAAAFRQRFKTDLLPPLLARYGDLRPVAEGVQPDFARAQSTGVMWRYHRLLADDGFVGTYRGYPVEIYDLRLWRGDAMFKENTKKGETAARIALRLTLPRALRATTAVTDQSVLLEDMRSQDEKLLPLQLEDPLFERVYAVRSTDEMGARAMLTPAVMQRMLAFSDGTGLSPPYLLAEGKQMLVVLRYNGGADLFEPLALNQPIAAQLLHIDAELRALFSIIDMMIEMAEAVVGR